MKTTKQLLAAVRAKLFEDNYPPTKYRVAKTLGVSRQTIGNWEAGKTMDDDSAMRVADYLGYNRCEVLVWMALERAKSPVARMEWRSVVKALAGTAVAILVGGSALAMAPNSFDISHGLTYSAAQATDFNIHYAPYVVAIKTALCGLFLASFMQWVRTSLARSR